MRLASALLFAAVVIVLTLPPAARANGDPASDVLYTQDVYIPYGNVLSGSLVEDVTETIADANDRGYRIKVAIIAAEIDLGLVRALWLKPKAYAPFLGRELLFFYRETLVVVMPNGLGVYRNDQNVAREKQIVARVKTGAGGDALAAAAITAVRRLAAAAGHPLPPPGSSGSGAGLLEIVLIAVGGALVLVLLGVGGGLLVRRRRAGEASRPA